MGSAVLLINSSFYPLVGGVENSLRSLSKVLSADGEKVVIVSSDSGMAKVDELSQPEELFGAYVYRYKQLPFFLYYITCFIMIRRLRKKYIFKEVVSRSFATTLCCYFSGLRRVKYVAPGVYAFQNSPSSVKKNNLFYLAKFFINSLLERLCYKVIDTVYVFSDSMKEQVLELNSGVDVIKVAPGIDRERFLPATVDEKKRLRKEIGVPLECKLLLCLGRVEAVKQFEKAIEALVYLPDDFFLAIVGDGSEKQLLVELSISLGVSDKVYFFGFSDEPEKFYKASDCFLMTSAYEPFGQVILESLATGVPVAGFYPDGNGVNSASFEILKYSRLVEGLSTFVSPKSFAAHIQNFLEMEFSQQDYDAVLERFTWMGLWRSICVPHD